SILLWLFFDPFKLLNRQERPVWIALREVRNVHDCFRQATTLPVVRAKLLGASRLSRCNDGNVRLHQRALFVLFQLRKRFMMLPELGSDCSSRKAVHWAMKALLNFRLKSTAITLRNWNH